MPFKSEPDIAAVFGAVRGVIIFRFLRMELFVKFRAAGKLGIEKLEAALPAVMQMDYPFIQKILNRGGFELMPASAQHLRRSSALNDCRMASRVEPQSGHFKLAGAGSFVHHASPVYIGFLP